MGGGATCGLLSGDCVPVLVQAARTLEAAASEKWRRRSETDGLVDAARDAESDCVVDEKSDEKSGEKSDGKSGFELGFKQFLQAAREQARACGGRVAFVLVARNGGPVQAGEGASAPT
jgi:hypothetical protein